MSLESWEKHKAGTMDERPSISQTTIQSLSTRKRKTLARDSTPTIACAFIFYNFVKWSPLRPMDNYLMKASHKAFILRMDQEWKLRSSVFSCLSFSFFKEENCGTSSFLEMFLFTWFFVFFSSSGSMCLALIYVMNARHRYFLKNVLAKTISGGFDWRKRTSTASPLPFQLMAFTSKFYFYTWVLFEFVLLSQLV